MIDTVPLIVDLDGTLIDGDSLHLSLAILARRHPWLLPALPLVVMRGRARFKQFVSDHVSLDAAALPYRTDVLEFVRHERASGRSLVLATAANGRIAHAVAEHLRLFDSIVASDGHHNAKGKRKLESIRAHIGSGDFDYMGDSMSDVPIFRAARRSYLVAPTRALIAALGDGGRVAAVFGEPRDTTP